MGKKKKKKALKKKLEITEKIVVILAGIADIIYVIYQFLKG